MLPMDDIERSGIDMAETILFHSFIINLVKILLQSTIIYKVTTNKLSEYKTITKFFI